MKVVRFGAFETNSSSMHSIIVVGKQNSNDNFTDGLKIIDGKLIIDDMYDIEFYRAPFEILSTFKEKLMYAIAAYPEDEVIKAVGELIIVKKIVYPNAWWFGESKPHKFYGDIDHQSVGVLQNFLARKHINLRDFLTQEKYMVVIDGDEYCIFDDLVQSGIVNDEIIKEREGDG